MSVASSATSSGGGERSRRYQFSDVFDLASFLTEQAQDETKTLIATLVNDVMAFRSFVHDRVQPAKHIDLFDRCVSLCACVCLRVSWCVP